MATEAIENGTEAAESDRSSLADAIALQRIEGNPLTPGEIAMFEMFEREGWPNDRRRSYILSSIGHGDTSTAE